METEPTLPSPVEDLIPHRKPLCMIDRLIDVKDHGGTAEAEVTSDNVMLDENGQLVLFRDTLQLENIDRNELEASIHALSLALSEYGTELLTFAGSG